MPDVVVITRLEKSAQDNGFDIAYMRDGAWLPFGSTQTSLRVWLSTQGNLFVAALSRADVLVSLDQFETIAMGALPHGAVAACRVIDIPSLHRFLRRAFQLSRTLPDELLHDFQREVAHLPRETEAERAVIQRVGQDIFRRGLLEYWEGRCAITGLAVPELLRASHIKPWADCDTDGERLDVFNGLLLVPHLDAAFDAGFITVALDGTVVCSNRLAADAQSVLGLTVPLKVHALQEAHESYLVWHRSRVFRL